jgi:transposase
MQAPDFPAKTKKRRHSAAFKRKLVALTEQSGASVAAIALEHGVNANLVFKWRRQQLGHSTSVKPRRPAVLLPVTIDPSPPIGAVSPVPPAVGSTAARATPVGAIEIEFSGARVRLRGAVDEASVRCVLKTLREAA